ncbi:UvrD-helicase domain-containing protein [Neolewinella antarctica]|uniref:DNA 3'-5' helicase n=1 Tax=Neolewinella antarctica TaxID=442734 RepID=A0ABX0XAD2_9BACT|nr:ATP-dependent helicase [Neolewinella antarctica]NJC26205.1 superfamily I DNA/RNA helicase [Neolewinella antarctica]
MKFTPEQEEIFTFVREGEGHGIIDAVAGAGKTTTIMACASFAPNPARVLFCAFNNSIAREIKRKFGERDMQAVSVKTIHALGLQLLRQHPEFARRLEIKENKYVSIYKSDALQEKLAPHQAQLTELSGYAGGGANGKKAFASKNLAFKIQRRLLDISQKHRSCLNGPSRKGFEQLIRHYGIFTAAEEDSETFSRELPHYYEMHRILLEAGSTMAAERHVIDFTDMIYLPFIWKLESAVKYDWIFIDECQDLSKAQFAIAAKYGQKGSRILAVGDPRQSIYGFTGADAESFDRVKRMTKATELPLTTCFRCPKDVISLAREIRPDITGAKRRKGKVAQILPDGLMRIAKPGDLVISRLRAPLLLLAFEFIDRDVKVKVAADEAAEFLGELKTLFKPDERQAAIARRFKTFRVLKEQVFARNMWVIRQESARIKNGDAREKYLEGETEYLEKRLDFLQKKYKQWKKSCRTVKALLKRIEDYLSAESDAVRLSTIHRAKGLEEKRVFILDYDKLPYIRQQQREWEMEQEENLRYVAITRAEEALYLVESPKKKAAEQDK